ncbi:MAG: ABC transporter permease [Gemmatimonadota bacterium]|nr:MAG: ABC transporter permease [Gemmatimonadota bacterium]
MTPRHGPPASQYRLPRLAVLLLHLTVRDRDVREGLLGDLQEELDNSAGASSTTRLWLATVGGAIALALRFTLARRSKHNDMSTDSDRRARAKTALDTVQRDVNYAVRQFARSPGFSLAAVVTLALGIGASTVAFTLVNGVLIQPLPFSDPDRLAILRERRADGSELTLSFPNFEDWRSECRSFTGITAIRFPSDGTVLGGDEPARGTILLVSREFFQVLGAQPILGRPILPEENRPGGDPVAVLGYGFWQRVFGSNSDLSSLSVTISGRQFAVVGVMPPGFKVLEQGDVYLPLEPNAFRVRSSHNYRAVGRLAPGVTWAQAQEEMDRIAQRIRDAYPDETRTVAVSMRPLRGEILGEVERPLLLLLGAAGLLLLLACSNVASTLLARCTAREREMAIRTAVGAARIRLIQQLFTESVILAGMAGLLGLGLSQLTLTLVRAGGSDLVPRLPTVTIDQTVIVFALSATAVTAVLFGLLPALRVSGDSAATLRGRQRGDTPRTSNAGWSLLVGGEVALAVILLAACGLLLRSLQQVLAVETNFRPEGVLTVALDFTGSQYESDTARVADLQELKRQFLSLPGVTSVGFVSHLPIEATSMTGAVLPAPVPDVIELEDAPPSSGWRVVDEDYFTTMGIPLLQGRVFTAEDGADAAPVVILNQAVANQAFPGEDPVGRLVQFVPFWPDVDLTVVGVVAEARDWRRAPGRQPEGFVYWSQRMNYTRYLTAVIRTSGHPAALAGPVRQRLRAVSPNVPGTIHTMSSLVGASFRERTFTLSVLASFAAVSLVLAAVGIYGVVSYSVSRRSREIGIRMALGAASGAVRRRMFAASFSVVSAGTAVGILCALLAGSIMESLLYDISPRDPVILIAAPAILLAAAALAIWVPVCRHTRVDPLVTMRVE